MLARRAKIFEIEKGRPHPLGATPNDLGVNFSVFSENATGVELLLFKKATDKKPQQIISLDSEHHNTFHFWHVFVKGLKAGTYYAYRVDGPNDLSQGHRFNKKKVLIDPYSRGITKYLWERRYALGDGRNLEQSMRSVVIDLGHYDWEDDKPLNRPINQTIIYEVHVGGFTKAPNSKCRFPGTFSALTEKIPYLKSLGITAVELMPVFDFDETQVLRKLPEGVHLRDFWGYNTLSFFAPHSGYCFSPMEGSHIKEFRDMVKALHKEGIEVILDVVFSHTGESNHEGPTINFKGFDNSIYYYLVENNKQYYMDYSGCGNTLNCNHPIVQKFILDCLEFWVDKMHVDGFRFDEASILSRGEDGSPLRHPPVLWQIELSERLANTKIIAEAWDAAGLYQVGYFPGYRFGEWNGIYRDEVRKFIRGDAGLANAVASKISGSSDIYQSSGRLPINSVNFITSHDGFTLNDLTSYNQKHNEANGENNQDGINENYSNNYGVEGVTDDQTTNEFRDKMIRNFVTILMLSRGVPMILYGDEIKRTQEGNNNAYCQDNKLSWFDWDNVNKEKGILRFFTKIIDFRKKHRSLCHKQFFSGKINSRGLADISWHGVKLNSPGWDNPQCRVLSFTIGGFKDDQDIHGIVNMDDRDCEFELPPVPGRRWFKTIDTSAQSPDDIADPGKEIWLFDQEKFFAKSKSVIVLISK